MVPEPPADAPPPRGGREGTLIVAEKMRILRLLRALDRAGIDPEQVPPVRASLVRLAEADALLTQLLELLDRDPAAQGGLGASLTQFLQSSEAVRGDVLDALAPAAQAAVRRTSAEVAVTEAEIWLEVEGLRRKPAPEKPRRAGKGPTAAQRRAAERALARPTLPPLAGAAQVAAQERRPLPPEDADLADWVASVPLSWRRATARLHDVPLSEDPVAWGSALLGRLSDPAWLATYLSERIGASEREVLVTLLTVGQVPLGAEVAELRDALAVHWDWESGIPASAGGRLRAAGLVYVGRRGKRLTAAIPPALREPLGRALEKADPRLAALPDRVRRGAAAKALQHAPHADPVLGRWKAHDRAITERLEEWVTKSLWDEAGIDAFFGGGPRVLQTDEETNTLVDHLLLDWRSPPGAPTVAERRLREHPFQDPDRQALAQAMAATRPALYRVGEIERGSTLTFEPLFPPGAPLVVSDRALSLTVEQGWLFGARLYPAGPYTLFRAVGEPLPASEERRLLRHLERARAAHAKASGQDDPAALIAADPAVIARALRACAPEG